MKFPTYSSAELRLILAKSFAWVTPEKAEEMKAELARRKETGAHESGRPITKLKRQNSK
jgi:hypothetical protein